MSSWLVWAVFVITFALLGFVGYHFAVRTLRFVTGAVAAAVIVAVTRYGVMHPAQTPANLANSFTRGFDELSVALIQPLLPHHRIPAPGQAGWLVIIAVLVFAYRELEVWAMRWEPPSVDTSALADDKQGTQKGGAPGQLDEDMTYRQRHDNLVAELRFRLPAVAVRAPAILPGGTKRNELASIVENSGVTGSGLAGAIVRFFGMLWPNPRRYQVRAWIEYGRRSASDKEPRTPATRVTIDLENAQTGGSVATKTLIASDFDQTASVVAGYVARRIFTEDPTAPPWCVGSPDGDDLAAMLIAGQQKVFPGGPDDVQFSRNLQISVLEKCKLDAGVARYELAQLYDLAGDHIKALRLHAMNREDYPRFYRGRYRLGMSLEMIANPAFELFDEEAPDAFESLRILDGWNVTSGAAFMCRELMQSQLSRARREELSAALQRALLTAAQKELRAVRQQLTLGRIMWAMLVHRDERAIRRPYWRLRERQGFHDGVRVAELLVTVRQSLRDKEADPARTISYYLRKASSWYQTRKALRIVTAITGDSASIKAVLDKKPPASAGSRRRPAAKTARPRWLPWQLRTPSWQAAYNTACLYAALEQSHTETDAMAHHAVISLKRAVCDRDCEMERPYDWISNDPDLRFLKSSEEFREFLLHQRLRDYPAESRTCVFCRRTDADVRIPRKLTFPMWIRDVPLPPDGRLDVSCARGIPRAALAGHIRTWTATEAPDITARAVCVPCSTGWMTEMEGAAQPLLA